ncbi:MAG: T9SS type A sorting domain-containing protein [Candidatus Kapabacteria bacterium]|nr:T9SS type A sorting domain-containing protein [Candidatus Kapabacteria bacterium]
MNNKYTNIDNIFDKARNLEPVLNDNEVRELINTSTVNPVSTGIFNYGVNKMTILSSMAALVISGLVLFNVIDSDKQVSENKQASVEISTAKSTPDVIEKLPDDENKDINRRQVKHDDVAINTYNVDDKVDLPKSTDKINGINAITLPYEYLELYNIKFDSETNNYEVTSGKMKVAIAPDMKTQFLSNAESNDSDHKLVPKLITSANGNVKIAFLNKNDSNYPKWNEGSQNQVLYTERIDDLADFDLEILKQMSPASIDSFLSHLGDTDNLGKFKIDINKLSIHMNNSDNIDVDSLLTTKRIQIDLDKSDSSNNIDKRIIIKRQNSGSKIDLLDSAELNTSQRIQIMLPESTMTKQETLPKENYFHLDGRLKMLSELTVNKLIPVRFDVPGGGADIIFWFEPTDELLEVVPDNIKSRLEAEIEAINSSEDICKAAPETGSETIMDVWRSCSGAIENMLVYPNPTNGPVSVNFQLKEDRKVKLTIHDLTGKLLLTLSPETLIRKGEFRENFNLAKLTPGMYLLVAQTHYGEQTLQRIVIE